MSLASSILLIMLSISVAVCGQILLKIGINRIGIVSLRGLNDFRQLFLGIIKSPLVISGLFLYVISAAVWLIVLSAVDLSFAYPFVGFTYVLILIVSKLILKEDVNLIRWIGALIITIGVVVISRG